MTDFEKDDIELKPCPFCGSTDIKLSMKTMGRWDVHKFHIAMYCKTCNCYGKRSIYEYKGERYSGFRKKMQEEALEIAMREWNTRA